MAELIDIGVNLTDRSFRDDRAAVLERARAAGVTTLILTGTTEAGSEAAAELAGAHPGVLYATAGVHPHHAKSCTDATLPRLRALAARPEVVALGECGLDYFRDNSPRPTQDRWFEAQLELAEELELPVFLHERDAHQRLVEILRRHPRVLGRGVVHCFTGTREQAEALLSMELFIGITGWICDERRGLHLREVVRHIPLDRLMIETDAPYLLPRTLPSPPKDRRNEPAFLVHVLATIAEALDRDPEEIGAATTETARRFFRLPSRGA